MAGAGRGRACCSLGMEGWTAAAGDRLPWLLDQPLIVAIPRVNCLLHAMGSVYFLAVISLRPVEFMRSWRMLPPLDAARAAADDDARKEALVDDHARVGGAYAFHGIWHGLLAVLAWRAAWAPLEELRTFAWICFTLIGAFACNYWAMAEAKAGPRGGDGEGDKRGGARRRLWGRGVWKAAGLLAMDSMAWSVLAAFLHKPLR